MIAKKECEYLKCHKCLFFASEKGICDFPFENVREPEKRQK